MPRSLDGDEFGFDTVATKKLVQASHRGQDSDAAACCCSAAFVPLLTK